MSWCTFLAVLFLIAVLAMRPWTYCFPTGTIRLHLLSDLIFPFISTLTLSLPTPLFCAFNLPVLLPRCPLPSPQTIITELSYCFPVCHPENGRKGGGGSIIVHNGRKKERCFQRPLLITRVTNHHQGGWKLFSSASKLASAARLHTVTWTALGHTDPRSVKLMCCTQLCSLTSSSSSKKNLTLMSSGKY